MIGNIPAPVFIAILFILGGLCFMYLEETGHKSKVGEPAALPTEKECVDLAHVVISARGIENSEVYTRARRLLEAVAKRKYSHLTRLRAEFIRELVQHQAIYGQLVPPQGTDTQ